VTGTVCLNTYAAHNLNDPDGVGGEHTQSSVTSYNSIAGNIAPNSGYLSGIFESNAAPSGTTPAVLNFTSGHLTTSFTSLSPQLDQTFFVGDGLTGDGTGSVQQFVVPAGATRLFLGICDGPGDDSAPGDYDDNTGTFTATFSVTSVPEPSSAVALAMAATFIMARRSLFQRRRTCSGQSI
jgi:hypothetical protein